ncbi:MAG: NTP transferase domain-containing protein [Candidatus Riflebacteria bacterium]|nr:NTP transferase domain-containing protein [Candidatus Riflebacteria bacterium]
MQKKLTALILAAGKGVRMKSTLPKVLHPVLGRPMVSYVIDACKFVGATDINLVIGFGRDAMKAALASENVKFVLQEPQLGTGHAVQCFAKKIDAPPENLLVVCGDTPLISRKSLSNLSEKHFSSKADLTMLTLVMKEPGLYGRILRDENGGITSIREAKDCDENQKLVREINLAVYLFNGPALFERLFKLKDDNRQKEYYLTDLVEMFHKEGLKIESLIEEDESSTLGINSRVDLALITGIMRSQIIRKHMENGVTIIDPNQTLIEPEVEISAETIIWPGSTLTGRTTIQEGCVIGPNSMISNSKLGKRVKASFCVVSGADIPESSVLEPYSYIEG